MIFTIVQKQDSSLRFPPVSSWYAARSVHFGAFFAACPGGTTPMGDKCCIPQSNWDGLDKRCVLLSNNPVVVTSPSGKQHLKAGGGAPPPPSCTPNCGGSNGAGYQCGSDGCGGSCGTCGPGLECLGHSCIPETGGAGGSSTTTGTTSGGGGGGIVTVGGGGDSGGGFDVNAFLESPVVWIAGGLLLVAVTYRIFKGKSPASPSTVVVK